ncbi:uncharacterized protein LOC130236477 [Danio aesculapii]|uniref:uncharacterized protein LOC130236477 n=1 Tax=Danio aesculapii TaxID=1142201 RepID=UPI0024BFAB09|nr:uncharacterized protein LOC130236477 [Danio aesculapii]
MSGLVSLQGSSGSTTAFTSGSGQIVFAQGKPDSFSSNAAVSGQSAYDQSSPSLSNSASPGTTYGVITQAQGTSQFALGSSPYATISSPKYVSQLTTGPSSKPFMSVYGTKTLSSAPFTLQGSATYGGPIQTQETTSQFVSGSTSPYVAISLPQDVPSQSAVPSSKQITSVYSTQTGSSAPFTLQRLVQAPDTSTVSGSLTPSVAVSLSQGVPSQSAVPSSKKTITSVYRTQTGSSAPYTFQESTTYGGLIQAQDASQFVSGSSTPYVALSMPQGVTSQSAVPSSKQITSVYSTQTGSSTPFTLQELLQGQDSTSQVVSVSSTPNVAVSLPQVFTSQSTTVPSSKKPITSVYSTKAGSSAPFTLQRLVQAPDATSKVVSGPLTPSVDLSFIQGVPSQSAVQSSNLLQGQGSTSKVVSVSSTPYVSVSLPQVVTSQSAVPSSKQITSIYDTQTGLSAPFTLQGGTTYSGLIQAQDSASQVVSGSSSPYVAVSLPQVVTSQSTTVPSSKKPIASVFGTQTGSSPFTLQGLLQGQESTSKVVSGSSAPSIAVSLTQGVTSQSAVPSSEQITTLYSTQTGSSAPFTFQEGTTYGGLIQASDTTSQFVSGSSTPYVSVSLPQGVTSQSAVPSSKQITSVYSTQTGLSAPFTLQGGTTYSGLIQAQDSASQVVSGSSSPYVAVSLPQVLTSQSTTVPSSKKPIASVYDTQTGSSAPFTLQGLLQGQESTSKVVSVSSPYVAVSRPQSITSQTTLPSSKQITTVYGTQTGSSAPFTLQGPLQGQASTRQVVSGSSTPYVAVSLPQSVISQSMSMPSSKQVTSVYSTQTGSSPTLNLQGLLQPQDSTDQFSTGSSSILQTSTTDTSNPSNSFSTLRRYYSVKG